jgi:hypothetical protein
MIFASSPLIYVNSSLSMTHPARRPFVSEGATEGESPRRVLSAAEATFSFTGWILESSIDQN